MSSAIFRRESPGLIVQLFGHDAAIAQGIEDTLVRGRGAEVGVVLGVLPKSHGGLLSRDIAGRIGCE